MATTDAAAGAKKRPRVDLLASLDAAFATKKSAPASKYTSEAAVHVAVANSQQAYQHPKHKKKGKKSGNGGLVPNHSQQQQQRQQGATSNNTNDSNKPAIDPLYSKLHVDILSAGLKNCSLFAQVKTLHKPYVLTKTLKQYFDTVMTHDATSTTSTAAAVAATDKLKNKALQLDNPIKSLDASKHAHSAARAQTAKLLSARQRRQLKLHLLDGAMPFRDAEQLGAIWRRYARDVFGTDGMASGLDDYARSVRVQNKLKTLDLSGCPITVIRARNPCAVGVNGIVVAEHAHVLQLCTPSSKIITLPKRDMRFRMALDDHRAVLVEGNWLLQRHK